MGVPDCYHGPILNVGGRVVIFALMEQQLARVRRERDDARAEIDRLRKALETVTVALDVDHDPPCGEGPCAVCWAWGTADLALSGIKAEVR